MHAFPSRPRHRRRVLLAAAPALAQPPAPRQLTADDYSRAERFMGYNTNPLVLNAGVRPNWLPDGRFWYRTQREAGPEFVLVDPVKRTKAPGLRSRQAGGRALGGRGPHLRARRACRSADRALRRRHAGAVQRRRSGGSRATSRATACTARSGPRRAPRSLSPDGKRAAFIRDWNLWVRDVATGQETALTTDGVKDYGYATDNAGWRFSDRPVVKWSPDSRKIATFQQDQRGVGEMYLVDTAWATRSSRPGSTRCPATGSSR